MAKSHFEPLDPKLLRTCCNPALFPFDTTDDVPDLEGFVGQERALSAARFGIDIKRDGYNIFAHGPAGVGKRSIMLALLEKEAVKKAPPDDICYVHNFKNPRYPKVLFLKAGMGKRLADDMAQLVEILCVSIPAIFDSKPFVDHIKEIQEEGRRRQERGFSELEKQAENQGIVILRTQDGFMLAAMKDGQVLSDKELQELPDPERKEKEALMDLLHKKITLLFEEVPSLQKAAREKIREAIRYFTLLQVGSALNDVRLKYEKVPEVLAYLNDVEHAIVENPSDFRVAKDSLGGMGKPTDPSAFNRYQINVIVDNSDLRGAPIIYEDAPTFANLVGRIDHSSQFGALTTDFTLIRAGALQKANGGYLLLDAVKLLSQPYAWDGLKRTLRAKEIRVENYFQILGYMTTVTLEPQPIPLNVKVVLFGTRQMYYLLAAYDPEFLELFKIGADFDEDIKVTPQTMLLFAQLIKNLAVRHGIKPLSKHAVIAVHEYGVRLAGDSKKVSTHVRKLTDLLHEADYFAARDNQPLIRDVDVNNAIAQQIFRASRVQEEQYEHIKRGILLLDFSGEHIGQVNGLSYYQIGDFAFGQPVRITARVGLGSGRIVDIEREVNLGGPIHSKGVLILTGYLNGHYARNNVISLSASLVFEQSYGGVEGDSATAAEACALLSAIAQIPLMQNYAITGSMNQYGEIQPIGGVNEKIEGFFDLCQAKGFTGEHGVIIPKANIEHLMLRPDIVLAAKAKQFNVYAVATIDEALSILTGQNAGERDEHGHFPVRSINAKVEAALKNFAHKANTARKTKRPASK